MFDLSLAEFSSSCFCLHAFRFEGFYAKMLRPSPETSALIRMAVKAVYASCLPKQLESIDTHSHT